MYINTNSNQLSLSPLSNLPSEVIQHIYGLLPLKDMGRLAQVNRVAYNSMPAPFVQRAQKYGFIGKDYDRAKSYIVSLLHELKTLKLNKINDAVRYVLQPDKLNDPEVVFTTIKALCSQHDDLKQELDKAVCESAQADSLRTALALGGDPNVRNICGKSPLHWAVENRDYSFVEFVIEKGGDPNIQDQDGRTPLYYAAKNGSFEIVELLLKKGANPNNKSHFDRRTPLYLAAQNGFFEIVKLLLKKDANPNISSEDRLTALFVAISEKKIEITKWLLGNGADINDGWGPLHSDYGWDCLHSDYGWDCLHRDYCWGPLHLAVLKRNFEIVKLLFEKSTKKDRDLTLIAAVNTEVKVDLEILKFLLENRVDPNIQDANGRTALQVAATRTHIENYLEVVKLLLAQGADPNIVKKEREVIDGRVYQRKMRPVLHVAAKAGELELARLLLEKGALPTSRGLGGYTTLHLAAENNHIELVKLFLENGINVFSKTDSGKTAYDLSSNKSIKKILTRYQAKHSSNPFLKLFYYLRYLFT